MGGGTRLHMEHIGFGPAEPGRSRHFPRARVRWVGSIDAINDMPAQPDSTTQEET
jgi:hypothetical protein